jgi:membrane protease subunit HflK
MKLDRRIRTSIISIITDLILISIKGTLAFLTGSLAILADAYHSFSDLIVSCTVLTSILIRRHQERKLGGPASGSTLPDSKTIQGQTAEEGSEQPHPRSTQEEFIPGYWIESLVAFFVSLLIFYTAYEIVSKVMASPPGQIRNIAFGVIGVTACVGIAYFISRFKIMVGRETDSPALVADGYHSRMDMFTSIAVLLSIMGQWVGIKLDPVVAVVIAVLIGITGLNLFISSFISFTHKSHIRVRGGWDRIFSLFERAVGFVSERFFKRRITLPKIDLSRLHPREWFSRRVVAGLAILMLVIYLSMGITVVRPDEVGVHFRFGAIVNEHLDPGLHFALPWPFEKIHKVNAQRVYRVEIGFRTDPNIIKSVSALLWEATHQVPGYQKILEESIGFSGDENLVDLSLVVHYRPRDAVVHLFRVSRIHDIMRGLTESFMREILATERADLMMTDGRRGILERLKELISEEVDRLDLGVEVLGVFCHDLHPPLNVVDAFREVFSAREDRERIINDAESYRNQALPRVGAEREKRLADSLAYELEKRIKAEGDVQRFLLGAEAYQQAPDITGYRLFLETVEATLAGKEKIIAHPKANLGGYRFWLFGPGKGLR